MYVGRLKVQVPGYLVFGCTCSINFGEMILHFPETQVSFWSGPLASSSETDGEKREPGLAKLFVAKGLRVFGVRGLGISLKIVPP